MFHYTYKVASSSGKYYVGRHSTSNIDDGYLGSGKWVRSLKNKKSLIKEILSYYECFDELLKAEAELLSEHVGKENCMNFNVNPSGFSSGALNPAHRRCQKQKLRERMKTDNPSKRSETRQKKSESMKGKPVFPVGYQMSDDHRQSISDGRKGIKYSEEGRKKLSEARRLQYETGKRSPPSFRGKQHTEETKAKMSKTAAAKPTFKCTHCGIETKAHTFKRWHGDNCRERLNELS